jgi:hypothetical protein
MSEQRVGKDWQSKGIDTFSTEAILGTLAHYGVQIDEASFREMAKEHFAVGIALQWGDSWKGKGQFVPFPLSAAEELWHRWLPEQLSPVEFSIAVAQLVSELNRAIDHQPDENGMRETRFKVVEGLLKRVPSEPGRFQSFVDDLFMALGEELVEEFDETSEVLAAENLDELAERFLKIEETLFPERVGVVRATMRAAKGEQTEAVAELRKFAASEIPEQRLLAIHCLARLEAFDDAAEMFLASEAFFAKLEDFRHDAAELALGLAEAVGAAATKRKLADLAERMLAGS